jgi:hypothetical protein
MNAMTRLVLTVPLPRVSKIEAIGGLKVRVQWGAGIRAPKSEEVDLAPLINSLKFYRPLRSDPTLFYSVHLIEEGAIIAWGDDNAIDMAADSVEQLAEESMTANDFRGFLKSNGFTHQEAGALLGRSRRQIENYLSGKERIPRTLSMACFGLVARKQQRSQRAGLYTSATAQTNKTETLPTTPLGIREPTATALPMQEAIGQ